MDEVLAGMRPRDQAGRELTRSAREGVRASDAAKRDDRSLSKRLEAIRATRDAALERIERYDEAIDRVVEELGRDHPMSQVLLDAQGG